METAAISSFFKPDQIMNLNFINKWLYEFKYYKYTSNEYINGNDHRRETYCVFYEIIWIQLWRSPDNGRRINAFGGSGVGVNRADAALFPLFRLFAL